MSRTNDYQPTPGSPAGLPDRDTLCQEIIREIARLRRFSNRGLWALSLFLLLSLLAWLDFPLLPQPDAAAAFLGSPPPPRLISVVLIIYTFSAIMLSLSRMTAGVEHRSSFCHVGYLTAFFLFYHYAKALHDNYWAVFGAGITILAVESYRIWTYCSEMIAKRTEDLEYVRRTGRLPIDD